MHGGMVWYNNIVALPKRATNECEKACDVSLAPPERNVECRISIDDSESHDTIWWWFVWWYGMYGGMVCMVVWHHTIPLPRVTCTLDDVVKDNNA